MRKILLSLVALFIIGAAAVHAKSLAVDLSKLPKGSENTTWSWDSGTSTGTFTWSATSYNSTELFPLGNYSTYTTLNLETMAGTADHFRIIIKFTNGAGQVTITPVSAGKVSLKLLDYTTKENLAKVETIRLSGANNCTGDVSVSSIYLEGPDINYIEDNTIQVTPTGATDLNGITGTGAAWDIKYPITIADATLFGSYTIDADPQSANIADYDYLLFNVTEASAGAKTFLRVFVSTEKSDGNGTRVCLYPHPIADYASVADDGWTAETTITAPGVYVVKISNYPLLRGVKNKAYWQGAAGSIKISLAYVGKGSPVAPVDKVVRTGEEALTDPNVTCFDVTKLEGTGLTFNASNPNALFIAKAGQLVNTKNVLVKSGDNYSSNNIELKDDNLFYAPFDILSTASSYTRNFDAAEAWGSAVLPFAMNVDDENNKNEAKFYMFKSATATTASFEEVKTGSIPANSPFIYQATGNSVKFVGTNISKTVSGYDLVLIGDGWYMAQSMESKVIDDVTTDDFFKDYDVYGISGADFVRATKKLTLKPFRAFYLKEKTGGEAPARLTIEIEEEATAITEVASEANGDGVVYNLAGQPVGDDYKGVVIKNGKKYIQ